MENGSSQYRQDSLTLWGAVSMGTGVMIGAGIFALTGQIAELAGSWFPLAFLVAAIIAGFSAYSYVKMAESYPSDAFFAKATPRDPGNAGNLSLDISKLDRSIE